MHSRALRLTVRGFWTGIVPLMLCANGRVFAQTPTVSALANSATATNVLAAGALAALYGANLTSSATPCNATANVNLTTNLCNTQVQVGSMLAPLVYVSATQVNLQIPYGLTPGPTSVVVMNGSTPSAAFTIQLSAYSPGIFNGATDPAGNLISNTNLATVNEGVSVYSEGLGVTTPGVASGNLAPSTQPYASTVTTPVILIDGVTQVTPSISILAPGFVGLYQINFTVPTLAPGSHTLAIQIGGVTSPTVAFPVAPLKFFQSEVSLGGGVYYQQFPDTNVFGYFNYVANSIFYHYDMGYEAFVPGTGADIYLYDFASGHWWYTSAALFPDLYDFTLKNWIYYFPDTKNAGHYTTNPRYFSNLTTGQIFTM